MNDHDALQRIGSYFVLLISVVSLWVSFNFRNWCSYGRETLMVAASTLTVTSIIRLARTEFGLIDLGQAAVLNAYAVIVHGTIMIGVILLHVLRHYYLRQIRNGRCNQWTQPPSQPR